MESAQLGIMVFGCSAIWFVGRRERWKRWGYILGMCSQPFWVWTSYEHAQWGIFILTFWYTYAWGQGIYNFWIKKEKE